VVASQFLCLADYFDMCSERKSNFAYLCTENCPVLDYSYRQMEASSSSEQNEQATCVICDFIISLERGNQASLKTQHTAKFSLLFP